MSETFGWDGDLEQLEPMPPRPPPSRPVCYGILGGCAPDRSFLLSPDGPFRPEHLYAWPAPGRHAALTSVLVGREEQLLAAASASAFLPLLAGQAVSPEVFLATLLDAPLAPRPGRNVLISQQLRDAPGGLYDNPPFHFPALGIGQQMRVSWEGELLALFVIGPQLYFEARVAGLS